MSREAAIRSVPLFQTLPDGELARLADALALRRLAPGDLLIEEGRAGDRCYIALAGELEIFKTLDGSERIYAVRSAGALLGELSLFSHERRHTASVRARTAAELLEMTQADLDALLLRHPPLVYAVLSMVSQRTQEIEAHTIRDLAEKNRALTLAYEELQAAQGRLIAQQKLEAELEVARSIQRSVLPRRLPQLPGYSLGVCMQPTQSVGGDLYDVFALPGGRVGLVVGDVAGHGVPAAFFMGLVYSLLRAEAARAESPAEALRSVNGHLLAMGDTSMFVTLIYAVLDPRSRALAYVRAGHELPIVRRAGGAIERPPQGLGQPLGLIEPVALDEGRIELEPGSQALLYTDGLTDARDARGAELGLAGLERAIAARGGGDAQALCDALLALAEAHSAGAPQHDDITMLAVAAA